MHKITIPAGSQNAYCAISWICLLICCSQIIWREACLFVIGIISFYYQEKIFWSFGRKHKDWSWSSLIAAILEASTVSSSASTTLNLQQAWKFLFFVQLVLIYQIFSDIYAICDNFTTSKLVLSFDAGHGSVVTTITKTRAFTAVTLQIIK